jgi:hypothetical protein
LKIPRRNEDNVAFSYPNAPFHFAPDSAEAFMPVLAFDRDSVKT